MNVLEKEKKVFEIYIRVFNKTQIEGFFKLKFASEKVNLTLIRHVRRSTVFPLPCMDNQIIHLIKLVLLGLKMLIHCGRDWSRVAKSIGHAKQISLVATNVVKWNFADQCGRSFTKFLWKILVLDHGSHRRRS